MPPRIEPCHALAGALDQLRDLVVRLDQDQYVTSGLGAGSSPLGVHVRHCLDLVDALCAGLATSEPIAYDRRVRGTPVETDRDLAIETLADRVERVRRIAPASLASTIEVEALVAPGQPELTLDSTGAREVVYVFHHTIHHLALIAAHARALGLAPDPDVGVAPSTLAAEGD